MTNLKGVLRREGPALAGALFALVLVGALLTGAFTTYLERALERKTADGASVLAQEALHRFADSVEPAQLQRIATGRDTIMTRLNVRTGDAVTGSTTVRVSRLADTVFAVTSTGELIAKGRPVVCSVDVVWRTDDWDGRPVEGKRPLCNGSKPGRDIIQTSPLDS